MDKSITFEVAIRTVSEANTSEHWSVSSRRHKGQQLFTRLAYHQNVKEMKFPCVITLVRLSPKLLDCEENLPMAFKWIKDELGACIFPDKVVAYLSKKGSVVSNKGHADSDPRIKWEYSQEKAKRQGIRIQITFLDEP